MPSPLHRRAFLQISVASAGAAVLSACSGDEASSETGVPRGELEVDADIFPQSLASGDPTPTSVVLWTRAVGADGPIDVWLQVSTDEEFDELVSLDGETSLQLKAESDADYCVRVLVENLEPRTVYYYRFVVENADGEFVSTRTGRTKTAPDEDADEAVRFAVLSCQDYSGRYYHSHARLAELELDFVVHLGDYIYETADNPDFQSSDAKRSVKFDDEDGALRINSEFAEQDGADAEVLAARSLDNYRNLYRIYRSDRDLQRLHERFPMIIIWDDHEFSNDAYGDHATYTNGREDEQDARRRANADQAWFEYMPVAYRAGKDFEFDPDEEFPDNLQIYRDFRFGRHVHLVMTDLRRFRADHVIPEDAFPGAVAIDSKQLAELRARLADEESKTADELAIPYVQIADFADGAYLELLQNQERDGLILGYRAEAFKGEISAEFINQLLTSIEDALSPIDLDDPDLERGIAYHQLGKTDEFTSFNTRYFTDADAFTLIARQRYLQSDGESERVMGETQERWFIKTLKESTSTWKVWGNEFTLMQRKANLKLPFVPEDLRRVYFLSAEDWDGSPNRRAKLLEQLSEVENLVAVTGDIHSFFVGDLGVENGEHVLEFVCGAASSSTFQSLLGNGMLPVEGADQVLESAGPLLQAGNSHMAFQDIATNGFGVFEANADELKATLYLLPFDEVHEANLKGDLADHFETVDFRVQSGSGRLERPTEDGYEVWDRERGDWA